MLALFAVKLVMLALFAVKLLMLALFAVKLVMLALFAVKLVMLAFVIFVFPLRYEFLADRLFFTYKFYVEISLCTSNVLPTETSVQNVHFFVTDNSPSMSTPLPE